VPELLVVSDSPVVFEELCSAVEEPGTNIRWARSGRIVTAALLERPADLVITELQVGSMGGLAVAMELTLEAGAGRLQSTPVLVVLDRRADVFLCKRTGVAGWLLKPIDPLRARAAVRTVLAGQPYHDTTFAPLPADVSPA
jgi:DNA-binding response OmpR family regulator